LHNTTAATSKGTVYLLALRLMLKLTFATQYDTQYDKNNNQCSRRYGQEKRLRVGLPALERLGTQAHGVLEFFLHTIAVSRSRVLIVCQVQQRTQLRQIHTLGYFGAQ
jgi:hypothetical protein